MHNFVRPVQIVAELCEIPAKYLLITPNVLKSVATNRSEERILHTSGTTVVPLVPSL